MLVSTVCVCVCASVCLCVFASAHVRANLGLIIKALLLADAQSGWQTNRQPNAEHSSTGSFFFFFPSFLLWSHILSSPSCQLILIHYLLGSHLFCFWKHAVLWIGTSGMWRQFQSSCEYWWVSDLLCARRRRLGDAKRFCFWCQLAAS